VGVEFSYDFEVLSVGENHPFSFNGLTTGRPSQAQWSAQWLTILASVGGKKQPGRPVLGDGKATDSLRLSYKLKQQSSRLALANAEHLCTTGWAYALGGGFTVLHGNGFGIFHFLLGPALNTICLHVSSSIAILQAE